VSEIEIKICLDKLKKSQRWLLQKVQEHDPVRFGKLTEQNLSKIINRTYAGTKDRADEVLNAIETVLKKTA
jgi:hypothetical protein